MYDLLKTMGVRDSVLKKRNRVTIYNADGSVASAGDDVTGPPQHAFTEHPKQSIFAQAVFSGTYKFLLYGGAIRGGKTYIALAIVFTLCRVFPGSRWAVVRKSYSALRRNTIPAFNKLRPANFISGLNYSTWSAKCTNGSEILFMPESFKEDPELNRFRGLEVNGFLPEEMNELEEATFHKMVERAGTWIIPSTRRVEDEVINGRKTGRKVEVERRAAQPPTLIVGTCNPAQNWVKRTFYDPYVEGNLKAPYFYLPASPYDNPHLPEGYVETLEEVLPESDKEQFLRGNWLAATDPLQLIKMEWLIAARDVEHVPGMNYLSLDVSRFGEDSAVMCHVNGNALRWFKEYRKQRTTTLSELLRREMATLPCSASNTRVDVVGVGGGVVDDCVKYGFHVVEVVAGGKAIVPREEVRRAKMMTQGKPYVGLRQPNERFEGEVAPWRFYDLRSQMFWTFARRLEAGEFAFPDALPPRAIEDLTAIRVEYHADRVIKIEDKQSIYDRIGRSTDFADALVMAAFEMEIPPRKTDATPSRSVRTYR